MIGGTESRPGKFNPGESNHDPTLLRRRVVWRQHTDTATGSATSMIWRLRGKRHAAVRPVGGHGDRHGDSPDANERAAPLRASIGRALLRVYVARAEYGDAAAGALPPFVPQGKAGPPPARGLALAAGHAPT